MYLNEVCRKRRALLGLIAATAAGAAEAGVTDLLRQLTGTQDPARLAVVLVDVTGSIGAADWGLYERTFQSLLDSNRAGDRVVLGAIGERPASKFIPQADRIIPRRD